MKEAVIAIVVGFFSGFTTWLFARRKNKAEAVSNEIDNTAKNVQMYQDMLDDLAKRYREILNELDKAKETIRERDKEIKELMELVTNLTDELRKYKQLNGKTQ